MDINNDDGNKLRFDKVNNLLCVFKMINTYDRFTIKELIVNINKYSNTYFILTTWTDDSVRLQVQDTLQVIVVAHINSQRIINFIQKFYNTKTGK